MQDVWPRGTNPHCVPQDCRRVPVHLLDLAGCLLLHLVWLSLSPVHKE